MKAIATVRHIADIEETDNGENIFLMSRKREKLQMKIRLLGDYSVKIIRPNEVVRKR